MSLFNSLLEFSIDTEDLDVIIDKVGDYFLDNADIEAALDWYTVATRKFPMAALFFNGMGYCLGKLRMYDEAVESVKKAVALEPKNHEYLSDLGWTLIEAGRYDEAEDILLRAVALAPPDYKMAQGNLDELHRRKSQGLDSRIKNGRGRGKT